MSQRNPTAKPTVIAGTSIESGNPNTGQVLFTHGGQKTFSKFSGTAGGDANIHVGAGRLDKAAYLPATLTYLSGNFASILFYDSAVAVSGGPLSASGHKVIGALTPTHTPSTLSGVIQVGGAPIELGFVFTSGLCHTSASGNPGFVVSYTTVVSGG